MPDSPSLHRGPAHEPTRRHRSRSASGSGITPASALATTGTFTADALLVLLFAMMGNREHDSGLAMGEIVSTAWPFLAGLALGWLVTASWRRPAQIWPAGVVVLVITVTAGMTLRQLFTDGGVQVSFVLVTLGVLAVLLLGHRAVTRLLLPRR